MGRFAAEVGPQVQNQGHPASGSRARTGGRQSPVWGGRRHGPGSAMPRKGVAEAAAALGTRRGRRALAAPGMKPEGHPGEVPPTVGTAMSPA